jgi:hypothetical protein
MSSQRLFIKLRRREVPVDGVDILNAMAFQAIAGFRDPRG